MAGGSDLLKALGIGAGTLGAGAALHGAGFGDALSFLDLPRQSLYNLFSAPYKTFETGDPSHLLGAIPGAAGAVLGGLVGGPVGVLAGSALGGALQGIGNATGREQFNAPSVSDLTGTEDFLPNMAVGMATDPLSYAGLGGTWRAGKAALGAKAATPVAELAAKTAAAEAAPVAKIAAPLVEPKPIGGFKTANGSDYAFENGLTTRTRSAVHPQGVGTDPQSLKTIFVDDATANEMTRLRKERGAARFTIEGDTIHLSNTRGEPIDSFKFSSSPDVGMAPVEFTVNRGNMYGGTHIGNPITELRPIPTAEIAPPIPTAKPIAPMFYSRLEEGVQKLPGTIKSESVINQLKKMGVTNEEIEATNIEKAIQGKTKVTKQDLLKHLEENKVQVGEVVKADYPLTNSPEAQRYRDLDDKYSTTGKLPPDEYKEYRDLQQKVSGDVRFEDRTTPGGENYHEMLLTTHPSKPGSEYAGRHWKEPDVVAHARFNDRVGPNGEKVLHIEEIQSDWHQEGKKSGYSSAAGEAEKKALENKLLSMDRNSPEYMKTWDRMKELSEASLHGVPDAPFKENWHELAMKRLIRHAAENGYDAITLNTGEQAQKITGGAIAGQAKFYGTQLSAKELGEIALKEVRDVADPLELTKRQADLRRGVITPEKYGELLKKEATVPDWMKKYAKEHGVKIESSELLGIAGEVKGHWPAEAGAAYVDARPSQKPVPVTMMPINASMREQALTRGFPLMQYGAPIGGGALLAALMGQQQG